MLVVLRFVLTNRGNKRLHGTGCIKSAAAIANSGQDKKLVGCLNNEIPCNKAVFTLLNQRKSAPASMA
ncbi:hypothetical protein PHMEG_00018457 [Phytophthora megakarya]|uniref:Uncharacterized protein n=1 Tax=Phytophthora megakarya TaxID=4795 RepID=A0A225VWJ9_9STRA|nr:hypothetical protein PHMEG_00018457 [Phytophthora megakarya]